VRAVAGRVFPLAPLPTRRGIGIPLAQLDFAGLINVFNIDHGDSPHALLVIAAVGGMLTFAVLALALAGSETRTPAPVGDPSPLLGSVFLLAAASIAVRGPPPRGTWREGGNRASRGWVGRGELLTVARLSPSEWRSTLDACVTAEQRLAPRQVRVAALRLHHRADCRHDEVGLALVDVVPAVLRHRAHRV
jgi:hypothetical protein